MIKNKKKKEVEFESLYEFRLYGKAYRVRQGEIKDQEYFIDEKSELIINKNLDPSHKEMAFIHGLLHAIFPDLDELVGRGNEEVIIGAFERGVMGFLRENDLKVVKREEHEK